MIGRSKIALETLAEGERDPLSAFVSDDVTRGVISRLAAERGWTAAVQAGGVSAAARALAVVDPPRILMVDIADSDEPVADVQALIGMLQHETKVIVLGTVNDVGFYRKLLSAGATDYLLKPTTSELVHDALARAETVSEQSRGAPGRLIHVVGTRGGVGASTIATSCAWLTANSLKRQTALIDLDLQFGTVALSLDLEPGAGLREALSDPDRLDDLFLERAMVRSGERLAVMGGEEALDDAPNFEVHAVNRLMAALRDKFDCVYVDLPLRLAIALPELVNTGTDLVAVCDLSLASLRDANRLRRFFKASDFEGRLLLAANLANSGRKGQLTKAEFIKGLEGELDYLIPYDEKSAAKAANTGTPLAAIGRSKTVSALGALSIALSGVTPVKRSFWKRFGK